jgi:hypothetical protein
LNRIELNEQCSATKTEEKYPGGGDNSAAEQKQRIKNTYAKWSVETKHEGKKDPNVENPGGKKGMPKKKDHGEEVGGKKSRGKKAAEKKLRVKACGKKTLGGSNFPLIFSRLHFIRQVGCTCYESW